MVKYTVLAKLVVKPCPPIPMDKKVFGSCKEVLQTRRAPVSLYEPPPFTSFLTFVHVQTVPTLMNLFDE